RSRGERAAAGNVDITCVAAGSEACVWRDKEFCARIPGNCGRSRGGAVSRKRFDASSERLGRIQRPSVVERRCVAHRETGETDSPQKDFAGGAVCIEAAKD